MRMQITQYGYSDDPCIDSNSLRSIGAWDNKLSEKSCALNSIAVNLLNVHPHDEILIKFPDGTAFIKSYDDKIPPCYPNARVDLFMKNGFDKSLADFAEVTKV